MNAVDANVLVYAVDRNGPVKRVQAVDLLDRLGKQGARPALLWQVAGEFLATMRRWEDQGRVSHAEIHLYLAQFRSMLPLILPASGILEKSLDLVTRYSLSHWDSMLLAACIEAGVDTL